MSGLASKIDVVEMTRRWNSDTDAGTDAVDAVAVFPVPGLKGNLFKLKGDPGNAVELSSNRNNRR